ncbi:precorrin-2 dehydrogenase/sirohydrochlorin ferrochelatase family protein [Magnetofaba australis]|uniref:precorrin-2 dehydrogenase n=1 Tax=Magnetofaba australis IT-1 TaxID=1434232 RepID=A0A1Y2K194_9PROT|nr:bifunctional precorrin-2 dehydrogenase/sirohydrochlorin ferrochelatase [Magnetofaba australis]OSM01396.1 putative precorrin-2 dehydrogenase [Magnetofaba australis IT-1]
MSQYMAELNLTDRAVLIVGGGQVARRKLNGLAECGARITVAAPQIDAGIQQQAAAWGGTLRRIPFHETLLNAAPRWTLVFAATGEAALNRRIAALCNQRALLCNCADGAEESGFRVPAVIRDDPIMAAVSTGGASPALSRALKEHFQENLQPGWAELARLFGAQREAVKQALPEDAARYRFWRETALAARDRLTHAPQENARWLQQRLQAAQQDADANRA